MQPICLKLENFGPYENSTIDFSNYYAQSLFLITGKTGAGKTTIFDGMSYALYGSTSGGLRQGKEMRSNFASIDKKTRVTFSFKQNNQTFEIEREPEQLVKKLRGDGYRELPASVRLTIFDEEKKEVNQLTKQKEVGLFLSELIQLNEQQFSQIVMLPQGEFRRFLIADSDSKEKVLRKLFNTYLYQNIADYLRQKKKTQEVALKDIKQELALLVSQLEWQKNFETDNLADMYYQDVLELYKEQELLYQEEIEVAKKKLKDLFWEQNKLQEKLQTTKNWLNQFEEQQVVFSKLADLAKEASGILETKAQVDLLKKVQKMEATFSYLKELTVEKVAAEQQEIELEKQEAKTKINIDQVEEEILVLLEKEEEINIAQKQVATLETSIPLFEKKNKLEEILLQLEVEVASLVNQKNETELKQKRMTKEILAIDSLIQTEPKLLEKKYQLSNELTQVQKQLAEVIDLTEQKIIFEEKQVAFTSLKEDLADSELNWHKKNEEQKQLKSDWAKSQIARLSLDLIDGIPCPVCGSTDHPNVFHGEELSDSEIKQLEMALEKIEEEVSKSRDVVVKLENKLDFSQKELTEFEQKLADLVTQLREYFKEVTKQELWLSVLQETQDVLKKEEAIILLELADITEKKSQLISLKNQEKQWQIELNEQEQKLRGIEDNKLQQETTFKELEKSLPDKWDTLVQVLAEKEALKSQVNNWNKTQEESIRKKEKLTQELLVIQTTLNNQKEKKADLMTKVAKESAKLNTFLKANSLTENELEQALLTLPQLDVLIEKISLYEKQEYALNDQAKKLADLLKNQEKPDIKPLLEQEAALKEKEKEQQNQLTTLSYQLKANQKIVEQVHQKESTMKEALDSLEEMTKLSNVMTGDGPNKLSMERFVLQTYLKRILERANEKFAKLTNGRYLFELKEETGSFKKKTGLEINIYDDNAGAIRSVNTLSGGESFIAALSLALSLAEVIQEESGGIKIDAMFIDEGFGSLDEDALEMAIRALESIEGEGRLIGIISHVRELRERIPQQLQVKATTDGKSYVEERLEFE